MDALTEMHLYFQLVLLLSLNQWSKMKEQTQHRHRPFAMLGEITLLCGALLG